MTDFDVNVPNFDDNDPSSCLLWGSSEVTTLDELKRARDILKQSKYVRRTPLIISHTLCSGDTVIDVDLKLESLQTTGSFKIRGMCYKFHVSDINTLRSAGVVTMSAGNAGKAISYLAQVEGVPAKVFMPSTAPPDRRQLMESMGATVVQVPGGELLSAVSDCIQTEGRVLLHPFDDVDIIRGHASCGLEILEDAPDADVIVVCCGGGGLLAGIAAAAKLSGSGARVVGVEPAGADSMGRSVVTGRAQWMPYGRTNTVAHGLAPPFAGRACYNHVSRFVDDMVTVSDEEMRLATKSLYEAGIVAEMSGAAAVAAVLFGHVGNIAGKRVVCTVSGRNISTVEFMHEVCEYHEGS